MYNINDICMHIPIGICLIDPSTVYASGNIYLPDYTAFERPLTWTTWLAKQMTTECDEKH